MATVTKRIYEEVEACERCKIKPCEYTVKIDITSSPNCIDPMAEVDLQQEWCASCAAMIFKRYSEPIKRKAKAAKAEAVEA